MSGGLATFAGVARCLQASGGVVRVAVGTASLDGVAVAVGLGQVALAALVLQTAVSSTSALARNAGRCERADQVPLTLAPIRPSRIFCALFLPLCELSARA